MRGPARVGLIVGLVMAGSAGPARAQAALQPWVAVALTPRQDPAPPGRGGRAGTEDSVSASELASMLDTYAIVQAQNALSLNDTQYGPFVVRLKRLQEVRRRNQRARNQVLNDLRKLAGPQAALPVDENAVRERLRTLRDLDDRAAAELQKAYDSLDEVLDVRQQARFRTFEETIERRKLDLVVRARERAARGGGS